MASSPRPTVASLSDRHDDLCGRVEDLANQMASLRKDQASIDTVRDSLVRVDRAWAIRTEVQDQLATRIAVLENRPVAQQARLAEAIKADTSWFGWRRRVLDIVLSALFK